MTLSEEECEEFVRGAAVAYALWDGGQESQEGTRAAKYLHATLLEGLKDHYAAENGWDRDDLSVMELAFVNERIMRSGVEFLVAHLNEANNMPVRTSASAWWEAYRTLLVKFKEVVKAQEEAIQKFHT